MLKSDLKSTLREFFRRIMPEAAIIFGCLIVDLVSKALVAANMDLGQTIVLIPKFLNFSYTLNDAAAFGSDFGLNDLWGATGTRIFFIVLTVVAVMFFVFLLFKKPRKKMLYRVAFSLIIAGAVGNLVDRIFIGSVRDFVQIEYFGLEIFGSKTFAIFNIADACIVVGAISLVIFFLFVDDAFKKSKTPEQAAEGASDESSGEAKDVLLGEISVADEEQALGSGDASVENMGEAPTVISDKAQTDGEEAQEADKAESGQKETSEGNG